MANEVVDFSEALATLREELAGVAVAGAGEPIAFRIEGVELEAKIVVTKNAAGSVGAKWWLLSGEAKAGQETAATQRLKINFSVVDRGTGEIAEVSDED